MLKVWVLVQEKRNDAWLTQWMCESLMTRTTLQIIIRYLSICGNQYKCTCCNVVKNSILLQINPIWKQLENICVRIPTHPYNLLHLMCSGCISAFLIWDLLKHSYLLRWHNFLILSKREFKLFSLKHCWWQNEKLNTWDLDRPHPRLLMLFLEEDHWHVL